MNKSKIPIFLICLANIIPISVGLIFYPLFFFDLSKNYENFTILFWSISLIFLYYLNAEKTNIAIGNLRKDMYNYQIEKEILAFSFISAILIIINIDWIADSRSLGIDVRSIRVKSFFLFEDIFFILLVYYFCRLVLNIRITNLLWFVGIVTGMAIVFGRFGLIVGQIMGVIILGSKNVGQSAARRVLMTVMVAGTIFGIYIIENIRAEDLASNRLAASEATQSFVDRLGEFATLGVTDSVFEWPDYSGFSDFGNLAYLYLPSVLFADKPVVEGGASYMQENFNLGGATENGQGTRFPIMLHIDSYRRFGWGGLIFAVLPGLFVRLNFIIFQFIRKKFSIPFIEIIILKYSLFMYPKSIIGLIELFFYTTIRSLIVLCSIIFVLRIFYIRVQRLK